MLLRRLALIVCVAVSPFMCGCKHLRLKVVKEDIRTGMYGNDRDLLYLNFTNIVRGKTSSDDLAKAGFTFNVPNVHKVTGVKLINFEYGSEAVKDEVKNLMAGLTNHSGIILYEIPYKFVTTVSDRIYLSKKKTTKVGPDDKYHILLNDGIVFYTSEDRNFYNITTDERSFLRGPIEIIGEAGGAASTAIKF